jgi:hypothetical protein
MAYRYDTTGVYTTAAHNLVTNSQDFENSAWTKTNCTATGNVIAEPLAGTITGDLITATSASAYASQNVTIVSGARVVVAIYAKAGGGGGNTFMRLRVQTGAEVASQWFNASTGAVGTTTSTTNLILSSPTATDAGSGWWRVSVIISTSSVTALNIGVGPANANGDGGQTGNTVYLWGMQTETHTALRAYLPTSAKNLLGFSEQLDNAAFTKNNCAVTANYATSPAGLTDADRVVPAASPGIAFVELQQNPASIVSGTTYTFSSYCKNSGYPYVQIIGTSATFGTFAVNFDLSSGTETAFTAGTSTVTGRGIVDVGGGWYRIYASVTAFATSGSSRMAVNIIPASNSARGVTWTPNGTDGVLQWGLMIGSSGSLDPYSVTVAASPTSAAYYGARFDHDPLTLEAKGLLIEEARTNLITNSVHVHYTGWGFANVNSKTPYAALAPDGTWSATLLEDLSTTVAQYTDFGVTVGGADTNYYVWSLYVKAGTSDVCHLRAYMIGGGTPLGSGIAAQFTFSTKTVVMTGTGGQGAATAADGGFTEVGNGWFRLWCRIQNNNTGNTSMTCRIFPAMAGGSAATTGTLYVWGAQAELGTFPTSYTATPPTWTARASVASYHDSSGVLQTAASGQARHSHRYNGSSWVPTGPIYELGVTNQMPGTMTGGTYWQGAATTIATGQTAPDGTTNGILLTESASGTQTYGASPLVGVVGAMTSGQAVTASIYAKAGTCNWLRFFLCDATTPTYSVVGWFNLTTGALGTVTMAGGATLGASAIQDVGGGWFRCSVSGVLSTATTFTQLIRMSSADNVTSDTGSKTMSVFGPQIEINSAMSSYIPTTTAAVARAADSSSFATATRNADTVTIQPLGSWLNTATGTVLVEFGFPDLFGSINSTVYQFDDGTGNNRIFLFGSGTTSTNFQVVAGAATQAVISRTSWLTANTVTKIAGAWATNDAQAAFGGTLGTADTVVTVPTGLTLLRLGATSAATQGRTHLRRLKVYDRRLPNAVLQMLTS